MSNSVAAVLDRTGTSIRKSTMITASVLNEAGYAASSVVLSKSIFHRQRQKRRQEASEQIKEDYMSRLSKSVVHWDGKLLPDATDQSGKVDRLPIILTSLNDGTTKLLGVPKLSSSSGRNITNVVIEEMKSWHCDNYVIGMCFDTTASNTGKTNSACKLLETACERNLLWLAC